MKLQEGKTYHVRTDSDHWIGELVSVDGPFTVTLARACWVANTGRLNLFMGGVAAPGMEIEPMYGTMMVHYRAIVEWPFPIPAKPVPE